MPNYGAINGTPQPTSNNHHDDNGPLLASKAPKLVYHFNATVTRTYADLTILFCYTITGLLDSSAIHTWGSFVSMQTGNTIYLGSGILSPKASTRWIRALTAILSFCFGSYIFSCFCGTRKRWVLVLSYTVQLLCVMVAAVLVTIGPKMSPEGPVTVWVVIPLALLGFQSGGQAVMSRVLEYGSLTSVVLTSIYCDLFSDQQLFAGLRENADRNRRAAAPILLLLGAMIGAVWDKTSIGLTGALWTGVVMKAIVVLSWLFWAEEKEDEDS